MSTESATVFATSTGISDVEVEAARALIGRPLRLPASYNSQATTDSIRHFAFALGDDNPRWCDPAYGATAAEQTVVAPPTWPYSVFAPGIGPGFGGLQGFHAGGRWTFVRPVVPGDILVPTAKLIEVKDVAGRRTGRTIIQTGQTDFRTPEGELIATSVSSTFRKPRPGFTDSMKVEPREPYVLDHDELESLEDRVLAYRRRGKQPRFWEDVTVGDPIDERVKGPLILNDITVFSVNIGIVSAGDIALKRRRAARDHPELAPTNRPIDWLTERVPVGQGHLDPSIARAVGVPTAYDNGYLRVCWMSQAVTDWMGDAGFIKSLEVRLKATNLVGDVLFVNGSVSDSRVEDTDEHVVDLDLVARRQDGDVSCTVNACVRLPARAKTTTNEQHL